MKKIIKISVVILLIGIMLISSYFIYKNMQEDKEQEEIFEELENIVTTNETNEEKEQKEDNVNLNKLYKINNDIVGWLKIENTNINYPVMQTKDRPDYYLRKNFYKEYSVFGTPYIDENCDIENGNNLIIYGHHINGNKMFGELENYKNEEYYNKHKFIKFYTLNEKAEYEIISVFKTTVYNDKGFKYYQYYNLEDEREFETFINKCKELSLYDTQKIAKYGDKLLTLSTCEYSQNNGRLVVVARKII